MNSSYEIEIFFLEFWIVYIVHGFGGADSAHQWYPQAAHGIRRR